MFKASRFHEFAYGHRVHGHESKCACLHGHNAGVTFECTAEGLDAVGRVIDFSVIKSRLCQWLEDNWDHRFLLWEKDPAVEAMRAIDPTVVAVPFNPTAENMAAYLVQVVGPAQLEGTGVRLCEVRVHETSKCSAVFNA